MTESVEPQNENVLTETQPIEPVAEASTNAPVTGEKVIALDENYEVVQKEDEGLPYLLPPTEQDILDEMSMLPAFRAEMRERHLNSLGDY